MSADETFVTFRVRGDFDPSSLGDRLQLTPSYRWAAGEVFGHRHPRTRTFSGWFLETRDSVESEEIDEHLCWVLDRIEPRSNEIADLIRRGIDVDIDCLWSSVGMSGGPWIPPKRCNCSACG